MPEEVGPAWTRSILRTLATNFEGIGIMYRPVLHISFVPVCHVLKNVFVLSFREVGHEVDERSYEGEDGFFLELDGSLS